MLETKVFKTVKVQGLLGGCGRHPTAWGGRTLPVTVAPLQRI
jgi:hypothetical protein